MHHSPLFLAQSSEFGLCSRQSGPNSAWPKAFQTTHCRSPVIGPGWECGPVLAEEMYGNVCKKLLGSLSLARDTCEKSTSSAPASFLLGMPVCDVMLGATAAILQP